MASFPSLLLAEITSQINYGLPILVSGSVSGRSQSKTAWSGSWPEVHRSEDDTDVTSFPCPTMPMFATTKRMYYYPPVPQTSLCVHISEEAEGTPRLSLDRGTSALEARHRRSQLFAWCSQQTEAADFWSGQEMRLPAHPTQLGEKHLTFRDLLSPFPTCTNMRGWHQGGRRLAALSFIWNITPRSCTVLNINHPLAPMKKSYGFY